MFLNSHELLVYLVRLDDTEQRWHMMSGQQFGDLLRTEDRLDPARPDQEYRELGKMLWALKADGSITFVDTVGKSLQGGRPDPHYAGFTMNDVFQFANIQVTTQGRTAVNAARPTVEINIEKLDILTILARMEQDVDAMPLAPEQKAEAKTKLRAAIDALGEVGKATLAETFAAAIRQATGLP
jgi:hypothetical protein